MRFGVFVGRFWRVVSGRAGQVQVRFSVEGEVDFAWVVQLGWCGQLMRSGLLQVTLKLKIQLAAIDVVPLPGWAEEGCAWPVE